MRPGPALAPLTAGPGTSEAPPHGQVRGWPGEDAEKEPGSARHEAREVVAMAKVAPIEPGNEKGRTPRRSRVSFSQEALPAPEPEPWVRLGTAIRRMFCRCGWYERLPVVAARKFLRGGVFGAVSVTCVFTSLFMSEIFSVAQVPRNIDLDVILTFSFAVFCIELLGLSVTDGNYFLSFFFFMDIIGTGTMVLDISFMFGADVTKPTRVSLAAGTGQLVVARAARAAKIGARASRLSRVLKLLRYLPMMQGKEEDKSKVRTARVISTQLTNILSTRIAFLTIGLVIVLPLFQIFNYPTVEDSMEAWTVQIATTAASFISTLKTGNSTTIAAARNELDAEAQRFFEFFAPLSYGPFSLCCPEDSSSATWLCNPAVFSSTSSPPFTSPQRPSSNWQYMFQGVCTSFDLSAPQQEESASNIGLIATVIVIMVVFSIALSSSITDVALLPLERMLATVRQKCREIFKYTEDLQEESDAEESDDDGEEMNDASEFLLLEKVVKKLAGIATIATAAKEVEMRDNMTEGEMAIVNWTQQGTGTMGGALRQRPSHNSHCSSKSNSDLVSPREMSLAIGKIPPDTLNALHTNSFCPLDVSKDVSLSVTAYLLLYNPTSSNWVSQHVEEATLLKFVAGIESQYLPNPFHNFGHGLDVLQTVWLSFETVSAVKFLTELQQFWLMVAAIGHDVAHPGINNQYLIESSHELAVRYNDRSPLENLHCSTLFQTLANPDMNVFKSLQKDVYKEVRKGMINSILHTDMVKHNEMIKELGLLYEMNSEAFDRLEPASAVHSSQAHVQLMMNALLHVADVSNPMKPWDLCHRYGMLCLDEFFAQGDLEKAAGIPVQMLNDRDKVNRPNSQIGFIEFVIAPLCEGVVKIFPQMDQLAVDLGQNITKWCEAWIKDSDPPPDAKEKVEARVKKVALRLKDVLRSGRGIVQV